MTVSFMVAHYHVQHHCNAYRDKNTNGTPCLPHTSLFTHPAPRFNCLSHRWLPGIRAMMIQWPQPKRTIRFTFVRDPLSRFVSAYRELEFR